MIELCWFEFSYAEKNDRVMRVRVAGVYVTSGERKMISSYAGSSCRGLCNVSGAEKNDRVMRVRVAGIDVTSGES